MFYDVTFLLIVPFLIFSLFAQSQVKSAYNRYSKVTNKKRVTGEQVARQLLTKSGITDVTVEKVKGQLTDHYDPRAKEVRLSDGIHGSTSIAALAVAAHEVGHAIQHNSNYAPLNLRSAILPVAQLGSNAGIWMFMLGMMLTFMTDGPMATQVMFIGIIFFSAAVSFQLITLPVEFNASKRAIALLQGNKFLEDDEIQPAKSVLNAAALTYIAAAAMAVAQLLRFVLIFANSRRN